LLRGGLAGLALVVNAVEEKAPDRALRTTDDEPLLVPIYCLPVLRYLLCWDDNGSASGKAWEPQMRMLLAGSQPQSGTPGATQTGAAERFRSAAS
jgi:hypothetical protein